MPLPEPPGHLGVSSPLSIWFALAIILPVALFFTLLVLRDYRRGRMARGQWGIYALIMSSCVISFFDATTNDFEPRLFHYLTSAIGLHGTQVLVALLVVACGWCAHRFKQINKLWYGYVEIVFGVFSSVMIVSRVDFAAVEFRNLSLAQFGTLVGAAYVVARGLNNVAESKESHSRQTN
jgi:hypothetical protein